MDTSYPTRGQASCTGRKSLHSGGSRRPQRAFSTSSFTTVLRTFPLILVLFSVIVHTSSATLLDRRKLGKHGEITTYGNSIADRSIPRADLHVRRDDLLNRHNEEITSSSATRFHATATAFASSTSGHATPTYTHAAAASLSSLPRPFDTPLGNNFTTQTCPQFFDKFLNDASFINCLPLSLFLQACSFYGFVR